MRAGSRAAAALLLLWGAHLLGVTMGAGVAIDNCKAAGSYIAISTSSAVSDPVPYLGPGYNYSAPNSDCLWNITSPTGQIDVLVNQLYIVDNPFCTSGALSIYDGSTLAAPLIMSQCDTWGYGLYQEHFYSSGRTAVVRLTTGGTPVFGFNLSITTGVTAPARQYCVSGWMAPANEVTGTISTVTPFGGDNYKPGHCYWRFDAGPGGMVRLDFTTFITDSFDKLTIYDGDGTTAVPVMGGSPLSGSLGAFTNISSGQYLTLEFYADANTETTGFQATWTYVSGACPDPLPPAFGTRTLLPGLAIFACLPGATMTGDTVMGCTGTMWNTSKPTCTPPVCPAFPTLANGAQRNSPSTTVYGVVLQFGCNSGYSLVGAENVTCGGVTLGQWDPMPTCYHGVACPTLSAPASGSLTCNGTLVGDVCRVNCSAGYTLLTAPPGGDDTITCLPTGLWDANLPSCVSATSSNCGDPGAPLGGTRTCSNFTLGGSCTFACTAATDTLVGVSQVTCLIGNQWSVVGLPVCTATVPPAPGEAPTVDSITPAITPLLGGVSITISGRNWNLPLRHVVIANSEIPPQNYTLSAVTDGAVVMAVHTQARSLLATSNSVALLTPDVYTTGYLRVQLTDALDQRFGLDNELYATDDCPQPGEYGIGRDCHPCPVGATCPGGNRMWPLPGYWNEGEQSGYVAACPEPPSRCTGGRESGCAQGFTGPLCGACANGYYARGSECVVCPAEDEDTVLYIVNGIFFAVMAATFVFTTDEQLSVVIDIFKVLQLLRAAGKDSSAQLPLGLRYVYEYLSLITIDYEFLKPACGQMVRPSFSLLFWGNAVMILILVTPSMLFLLIMRTVRKKHYAFYHNRMYRTATIYLTLLYFVIATRVFEAIDCVTVGSKRVLNVDTTTTCDGANPVYIVGWIGVLLFSAGVPLGYLAFLLHLYKEKKLEEPTSYARYGYMYDGLLLTKFRFLFTIIPFFHLLFTALAWTVLPSGTTPYICSLVSFALVQVTVLVWQPFKAAYQNAAIQFVYGLGMASVLLNLLNLSTLALPESTIYGALGGTLIAVGVLTVVVFVRGLKRQHANAVAPLELANIKDIDAEGAEEDSAAPGGNEGEDTTARGDREALSPTALSPLATDRSATNSSSALPLLASANRASDSSELPVRTAPQVG